jgi:hypothetical protein
MLVILHPVLLDFVDGLPIVFIDVLQGQFDILFDVSIHFLNKSQFQQLTP